MLARCTNGDLLAPAFRPGHFLLRGPGRQELARSSSSEPLGIANLFAQLLAGTLKIFLLTILTQEMLASNWSALLAGRGKEVEFPCIALLRSERLRMRQNRYLIKFSHLAPLLCFPLHMATADVGYRF